jgi:hypothetical protein
MDTINHLLEHHWRNLIKETRSLRVFLQRFVNVFGALVNQN